jgi:hypothetical protein
VAPCETTMPFHKPYIKMPAKHIICPCLGSVK